MGIALRVHNKILANLEFKRLMKICNEVDEAHDINHALRVERYSLKIGEDEKADLEILEAASMLHDIARGLEQKGRVRDHVIEGTKLAKKILFDIDFPKEKIDSVCYAISAHRRKDGVEAKTSESKILQDADLLDTYGLVYVVRSILWGLQSRRYRRPIFVDKNIENFDWIKDKNLSTIHYLMYRLLNPKLSPKTLNTKLGRKIAAQKNKYIRNFIKEFIEEWRGDI